jgi:SAM-dependent methyltransferase
MERKPFKERVKPFVPKWLWPFAKSFYYASLRAYYYPGHRYVCPLCQARIRKLLYYGYDFPVLVEKQVVGGMPNFGMCPVCGCLERTRLLYLYLLHQTDFFRRPQKVLHFAPEPMIERLARKALGSNYLTADLVPSRLMIKVDITEIPFPEDAFDSIICCHVLEHVPDDGKAMRELYRVLKPGGWAVVQVPISAVLQKTYEDFSIASEAGRELAFGQFDHVRIYAADYRERLERVGFQVTIFHWPVEPAKFGGRENLFGLNEREAVYRVNKPPKA